ncbi:type I-E CRISPR-associated protein Cse2/CasB [Streptomyces sp. NPDC090085]|uniref:type I-E CRISPR-associated protein Cse2/CasB n=1 Tax=Streptomyces sp. NPDC090085 TaxID=3365943 RepID=UPI00380085B2
MADPSPATETPKPPGVQLSGWLTGLVRARDLKTLADLRRPDALTEARLKAANFAPTEAQRDQYERVAFLFARFHAGASTPSAGFDNVGGALRRIGSGGGRGPGDAGAKRLFEVITASHSIPWRHLQHAVERARSCSVAPPNWAQLTEDVALWTSRGRPVAYAWARAFYTPTYRNGGSK